MENIMDFVEIMVYGSEILNVLQVAKGTGLGTACRPRPRVGFFWPDLMMQLVILNILLKRYNREGFSSVV